MIRCLPSLKRFAPEAILIPSVRLLAAGWEECTELSECRGCLWVGFTMVLSVVLISEPWELLYSMSGQENHASFPDTLFWGAASEPGFVPGYPRARFQKACAVLTGDDRQSQSANVRL